MWLEPSEQRRVVDVDIKEIIGDLTMQALSGC